MTDTPVLLEVHQRVAVVTLNRPDARNALSRRLLSELRRTMADLDERPDVDVVVLTGADPAFCAGLDLKELGRDGGVLNDDRPAGAATTPATTPVTTAAAPSAADGPGRRRTVLASSKPVIGAVNGVAVTGGLELALNCDFLIASERARFADTHARIGVQPLWGLTVLLPEAVGLRRAREMSASGNFVDAATALTWGLVNHVVPHDELLPFACRLAADITSSDQHALRTLLETYRQSSLLTGADAWALETARAAEFHGPGVDPAEIERRRAGVVDRGRSQV
ncbi:MAG TPA: enoyl-CoA hydratase [Acidimicrobiales bacterium]|nr:enoyl-CoA hydratase [Acidimicrobiales bacterium]